LRISLRREPFAAVVAEEMAPALREALGAVAAGRAVFFMRRVVSKVMSVGMEGQG
jgi:hypothetical protein